MRGVNGQLDKMYGDIFESRGVVPCGRIPGLNSAGDCFRMLPERGEGYAWVYRVNPYVTITIMNQVHYADTLCTFHQPDYICIGYFYSVSGEILTPYRRLIPGTIQSYIGRESEYRMILHKRVPVESVSVTMLPEYYQTYLQEKYGSAYEDPTDAITLADGRHDLPELVSVFNQIKGYLGYGMSARLFYEGKVEEMLSLVLEHAKRADAGKAPAARALSREDVEVLISVAAYIDDHYQEAIRTEFLARTACMSQAKLKYAFKSVYHTTIQHYIVAKRMTQAERLLRDTELPVAQIAALTGYQRLSSLSEMFRRHTGLTPMEYRNLHKRKGPPEGTT